MQTENKNRLFGVILILIASIAFSSKSVIVKLAYKEGIDSISALFLRMSLALPIFLFISILEYRKKNISNSVLFQIFILGFLGYYLASLLDFIGLEYISAGLERLILFIYPTIVILIGVFFLNKKISKLEILSLLFCYLGIIIVFSSEALEKNRNTILGASIIFICAITYSIYFIGSGELIPKVGANFFTAFAMTVACITICIHFVLVRPIKLIGDFSPRIWFFGFLMATLNTIIPTFLLSYGIKKIGSSSSAIIASVGPVSTILLAWTFLDEKIGIQELIGTCFIIFGIFLVSQKK